MTWRRKLLALVLYGIWMVYRLTLRIQFVNEDKRRQAENYHEKGCFTLALWHENILLITTAMAGQLYHIDAFNQPGVEGGKIATYALMGRKGYEEKAQEIQGRPARDPRYIL